MNNKKFVKEYKAHVAGMATEDLLHFQKRRMALREHMREIGVEPNLEHSAIIDKIINDALRARGVY